MMWIGVLWLAAGSLSAQTVSLNTSTSLSEPCASAKAVHDMRCSNYTGFKARLGIGANALKARGQQRQVSVHPLSPRHERLVER